MVTDPVVVNLHDLVSIIVMSGYSRVTNFTFVYQLLLITAKKYFVLPLQELEGLVLKQQVVASNLYKNFIINFAIILGKKENYRLSTACKHS